MTQDSYVVIKRSHLTGGIQAHRVGVPPEQNLLEATYDLFHDEFLKKSSFTLMIPHVSYLRTVEHEYVFIKENIVDSTINT